MSQDHNHFHATWECKYHVVFTPKYRKKMLFGQIRRHLGSVFHELAQRKECQIEEGHRMPDHVHMLISIPPKYSVAEVIDISKVKALSGSRRMWNAGCGIFVATNWGGGATSFRPAGGTRRQSAPISEIRRWRTSSWIRCNSSSRPHEVRTKILKSLITAYGGSPSNLQLCWGLLAPCALGV